MKQFFKLMMFIVLILSTSLPLISFGQQKHWDTSGISILKDSAKMANILSGFINKYAKAFDTSVNFSATNAINLIATADTKDIVLFNATVSSTTSKSNTFFQQEVDATKAALCTALYKKLMPNGTVWDDPSSPHPGKTKLTTGVIFESTPLLKWLQSIVSIYPKAKFELMPCIYDPTYIDYAITTLNDPNAKSDYKNRISVLIWPCDNTGAPLKDQNGKAVNPYNLGGLYP